jgi:DNA-binding NarL/FixJ family response regulator
MVLAGEGGIEVVGEAGDGATAVDMAQALRPDVVLMDVRMPRMDGIEATRRIAAAARDVRVLVLTTFDLDEYAFAALRAGASGFLLKDARPEELVSAIRAVAAGDAAISPRVTKKMLDLFAARLPAPGSPAGPARSFTAETEPRHGGGGGAPGRDAIVRKLTRRELEVFTALSEGQSNAEIAAALHLSETTVKSHVASILGKLSLRDRVQAVVLAYESGFK